MVTSCFRRKWKYGRFARMRNASGHGIIRSFFGYEADTPRSTERISSILWKWLCMFSLYATVWPLFSICSLNYYCKYCAHPAVLHDDNAFSDVPIPRKICAPIPDTIGLATFVCVGPYAYEFISVRSSRAVIFCRMRPVNVNTCARPVCNMRFMRQTQWKIRNFTRLEKLRLLKKNKIEP